MTMDGAMTASWRLQVVALVWVALARTEEVLKRPW